MIVPDTSSCDWKGWLECIVCAYVLYRLGSSSLESLAADEAAAAAAASAAAAAAQRLHIQRLAAAMRYSPYHFSVSPHCLPIPGTVLSSHTHYSL